jgi:hypothetical protein
MSGCHLNHLNDKENTPPGLSKKESRSCALKERLFCGKERLILSKRTAQTINPSGSNFNLSRSNE